MRNILEKKKIKIIIKFSIENYQKIRSPKKMPKNVFITGVTGFIGSAVANRFANSGYNVYGLIRSEEKEKEFIGKEILPILG